MDTYKIVRFYHPNLNKPNEVVKTGLSLDEAMTHCKYPDSREPGEFFDGFVLEDD